MDQPQFLDDPQAEKAGLLSGNFDHHEHRKTHRKRGIFFKGIIIAVIIFSWASFHRISKTLRHHKKGDAGNDHGDKPLDFEDIIPSEKLEWHPCRELFMCARLTVPMDYHRPLNASKDHPKVHIALLMAPGKHDGPKKFSTSPLLVNPGGPGGSGTAIVQFLGSHIQSIVDAGQDVIGFDPRGIAATTPRLDCFSYPLDGADVDAMSDYEGEDYVRGNYHRMAWMNAGREIGLVNSSSVALPKLDVRARTIAKLCQEKDSLSGKDSIFKYAHTPSVARDMLSIIDAWDEWIDSLSDGSTESHCAPEEKTDSSAKPKYPLDTKGKLVFWGFSYGTLLGATFASMFPDRVGRVVLDGVVDADHYVAPVWADSIRDSDTIFNSFPKYCHKAKESCVLYRAGDKLSDVEDRFQGAVTNLKENPLQIIDKFSHSPVVVTINDIRLLFFGMLYAPMQGFAVIAQIINDIVQGDNTLLGQIYSVGGPEIFCGHYFPAWMYPTEAQAAIMCSDKRYPLNETVPNLEKLFEKMSNLSSFADVWMSVMMGCDGWGIKAIDPPMKWDDHPAHRQKPIKTSFPLLFLSNTADPVTPLHAGVKMARKFVDAGLVEQKSMGHCTLAATSLCTLKKIKAYFRDGKVPPHPIQGGSGSELVDGKWDRCEADEWPFHRYDATEWIEATGNSEEALRDAESMAAMQEIQEVFKDFKFFSPISGHDPRNYKAT